MEDEKRSWKPKKKREPTEIEVAYGFLALRVAHLEKNPGVAVSDMELTRLYGAPRLSTDRER